MRPLQLLLALIVAIAALLTACSGGGSTAAPAGLSGSGHLTVGVTDTPFTHDLVEEALVAVDRVTVHASASTRSGWHTVYEGAALEFDLLDLRNGVTRTLVDLAEVPAGRYAKVRLRVASSSLRLVGGAEFSTAAGNLHLTSTATSGMQIQIEPPIEVRDGFSRSLLLDFDLSRTFHPVPANDPMAATSFLLHNGVRAINVSTSGDLRGVVRSGNGASLVADATVWVLPPGETEVVLSVASTASDANGGWAILGLDAGAYDVLARHAGLMDRIDGVTVSRGTATLVDLDLE